MTRNEQALPVEQALKACPFPHEVKRGVFIDVDEDDFGIVRGACSDCGACGPFVVIEGTPASDDEKAEAVRLWNALSQPASGAVGREKVLREALEPFAKLAGPINGEEGRPTYLEAISGPNGTDELLLTTYVGDGQRTEILDAEDFRRAAAALAGQRTWRPHLDYAGEPMAEGQFRDPPTELDAALAAPGQDEG